MSDIGPDLQRLLERVRGATGPDDTIDGDVTRAFMPSNSGWPKYTASVDAVAALAERVLPGSDLTVTFGHTPYAKVELFRPSYLCITERGATSALAALATVLAAKIAAEPVTARVSETAKG